MGLSRFRQQPDRRAKMSKCFERFAELHQGYGQIVLRARILRIDSQGRLVLGNGERQIAGSGGDVAQPDMRSRGAWIERKRMVKVGGSRLGITDLGE